VKLEAAAESMKSGDLLFFRGTAPHSRLIQLVTRSVYSHVAVVIALRIAGRRTLCAFEALEGVGVRLTPLDAYLRECQHAGCVVDWYAIADASIDRQRIVAYCLEVWGERYSSLWQFVVSFGRLGRWVAQKLGVRLELDPSRPFCSWVAAAALMHAGYEPSDELEPARIDPGAVSRFPCLRRRGGLEI